MTISLALAGVTVGLVLLAQAVGLLAVGARAVVFVAAGMFVADWLVLRTLLQPRGPRTVVPDRVRFMLDALAEGVLLLDKRERIILANTAFVETVGRPLGQLLRKSASQFAWRAPGEEGPPEELPWAKAIRSGQVVTGAPLALCEGERPARTFAINAAPIFAEDGTNRGAMVTFDDMTGLEQHNTRLKELLWMLKESKDRVKQQNRQLQRLATRDPLTGCLNRRAFFERLETDWDASRRYGNQLACVMMDVDHFKRVNDTRGHAAGDQVLQGLARTLRAAARSSDLVARYGGEEFCIILPNSSVEQAAATAERFRKAIADRTHAGVRATASFGVSSAELGAASAQLLVNQADRALYIAKNGGRNRVVRYDKLPEGLEPLQGATADEPEGGRTAERAIPLEVVSALISALEHRDGTTGEHAREVADFCAVAAEDLMSPSECFTLTVAGQLHDVGKIGVPDAVLLKPGPLTDEEWALMRRHEEMGVEIIESAFSCRELTAVIRHHHAWFGGNPRAPHLPSGEDIPLGARILAIADAFSAMISDRPYRKGRSREEAFEELRRCAGTQFDPKLVEHFIHAVSERCALPPDEAPLDLPPEASARDVAEAVDRLEAALLATDYEAFAAAAAGLKALGEARHLPGIAEMGAKLERAATRKPSPDLADLLSVMTHLARCCRTGAPQTPFASAPGPGNPAEPALRAQGAA